MPRAVFTHAERGSKPQEDRRSAVLEKKTTQFGVLGRKERGERTPKKQLVKGVTPPKAGHALLENVTTTTETAIKQATGRHGAQRGPNHLKEAPRRPTITSGRNCSSETRAPKEGPVSKEKRDGLHPQSR